MDGKTTDFNPIAFQACGAEPTMRACYERGHICIQAESESEDTYTILIVNTSGKLMIDQTSPIVKGTNSISFTPNFPDGMYIINVRSTTNSNIHFSKKLVFGDCSFKNI